MKASESRKIDRTIAVAAAVIGLGLASWAIFNANHFGARFTAGTGPAGVHGTDVFAKGEKMLEATSQATESVAAPKPAAWKRSSAAGRERGFLASTNLVFRRGKDSASDSIVDLDKAEPRLRDPFPNSYWQQYPGLALESPNVGDLDPDKDYFSTLQEYEYGQKLNTEFNPTDAKSHPPMYLLLRYAQLDAAPYKLKFSTANAPDFNLRHEDDNKDRKWSDTATVKEDDNGNGKLDEGEDKNFNGVLDPAKAAGKKGDEGRFVVLSYKVIQVVEDGFPQNKTEIVVEDTFRPQRDPLRKFSMVEGETKDLPAKLVTFDYLPKPGAPISKKEFEKFTLPDTLAPSYLLLSADADKAVLEHEEGGVKKQITLPRGQAPVP